jgi:hypothetical protein
LVGPIIMSRKVGGIATILLRNDPEERVFRLLRGGSLQSRKFACTLNIKSKLREYSQCITVQWFLGLSTTARYESNIRPHVFILLCPKI